MGHSGLYANNSRFAEQTFDSHYRYPIQVFHLVLGSHPLYSRQWSHIQRFGLFVHVLVESFTQLTHNSHNSHNSHNFHTMRFTTALALSLVGAALAAPAPIASQGDGKAMIGRDGKNAPAERNVAGLDPRLCRFGCLKVAAPTKTTTSTTTTATP
ncbi:hypothetical protein BDV93DRAFT_320336 [Ceratobasidium sp. AG-I]|nr:hypothetical protein BDV93DRAFT_320336 [Ceratobasidium sp. AG-I]